MKFEMNGDVYDDAYDVAEEIAYNLDDSWVDEQIYNDYGSEIEICGFHFDSVDAIQKLSMKCYETLKDSYLNYLVVHLKNRFNRMTCGAVDNVLGYEVKCLTREYDE